MNKYTGKKEYNALRKLREKLLVKDKNLLTPVKNQKHQVKYKCLIQY